MIIQIVAAFAEKGVMATASLRSVVHHLRRLAGDPSLAGAGDRELLERFAERQDEAAFATLVERYGPLVWGVCRRILRQTQDAEDTFQATFLVLARKAGSVGWRESVGGWLYEVAYRLASEARGKAARRRFHEDRARLAARATTRSNPSAQELSDVLDEELQRLPAKIRSPMFLCYLEGRTTDQAARQLGCSLRTLHRRLADGRELLRLRLTRRGVALSSALLVLALQQDLWAALPPALFTATLSEAAAFAAGVTGASARVALIAQGFLKGMLMTKIKLAALLVFVLGALTTGGIFLDRTAQARPQYASQAQPEAAVARTAAPADGAPKPVLDVGPFARQVWTIMDTVSKQHIDPCPRTEMIVAGVRGLRRAAKLSIPPDLERRAAAVQTVEDFAALLRHAWPAADNSPPPDKLEAAFLEGLSARVAGEVHLLGSKDELKIQEQISNNRYVGTGIQIAHNKEADRAQIIVPIRRGTARRAGIKMNDIIEQVDGKDTKGQSIKTIVDWIRGEEGTSVTLVVRQPDAKEARTYTLKREVVPFDTVHGHSRLNENDWDYHAVAGQPIAYARIGTINISTLHELRQLEQKLKSEGYRALVLDVRFGSSSGELRHAALVADGLLDGGVMWAYRGRDEQSRVESRADRECLFRDWPIALLTNDTMDRVTSLVAAALQDNGRAVLVGEPSKADCFINSVVMLPDGKSGIIFRTGRVERAAKGRDWPVTPDHLVPLDEKQKKALADWLRAEEIADKAPEPNAKIPADPQLDKAIAVMREALQQP
jgi:C-terminal peptidase prc